MVSVAASMATAVFNSEGINHFRAKPHAYFDARAFNVPRDEVVNCFIWRQKDATRNSVQMYGQSKFSHKELQGKSCDEIQEMLFYNHKINWNNEPTDQKRGTAVYKVQIETPMGFDRTQTLIDQEIPIFTQDRDFIQKWVDIEEE